MEIWQIVAVCAGALLFVPKTWWGKVFGVFTSIKTKVDVVPETNIVDVHTNNLVTLVADWEDFRRRSLALKLDEVVAKMDEAFPLLLKVVQDERNK